ncbi:hypothetical protein DL767_011377 [Monosporascus sp. MG133]|nr:hypothetical protein DL767_011377 [Monosporascus sp. MG133]
MSTESQQPEMVETPEETLFHTTSKRGERNLDDRHGREQSNGRSVAADQNVEELVRRVSNTRVKPSSPASLTSTPTSHTDYDAANSDLSPRPGSNLDPKSAIFDARVWIREFIKLTESDPASAPPRALGVAIKDLSVFGSSTGVQFQKSVGSVLIGIAKDLVRVASSSKRQERRLGILRDFEGIVEKGEMLLVLGPPGSGCSTFLKTLSSQTADLEFNLVNRDVMMAIFGLTHTVDTRVGDDVVRGVSGGERKRVSIAEAAVTGAKFQCWDNSARGLDSANAISFCRNLRLHADLLGVASAVTMALILGSMFYNLKPDSSSFYYRGGIIFFSLMFNAFSSQLEVPTICAERPIVKKQNRTQPLLLFRLVTLFATLSQSAMFRTMASITRTPEQAMIPSALLRMGLMIYTGFTMPTAYMPGWSRWMGYINPLAYSFEARMATSSMVGSLTVLGWSHRVRDTKACHRSLESAPLWARNLGPNGDRYINLSFDYYNSHKWRNVGIPCGFTLFLFATYLVMAEFSKPPKTRGEVLVFRRGQIPPAVKAEKSATRDADPGAQAHGNQPVVAEKGEPNVGRGSFNGNGLTAGTSVFHWEDLCYDTRVKGGAERRLLDHVDGWVKPGVSTILMGVSGAGKTTLLDVLATGVSIGVISGDTLINGDIHLSTMTVREALEFSAVLRQSSEIPRKEKIQYVDYVINILEMQEFAGAVIGVPGEGLNVEQRKRLTIGVELAARLQLLGIFDEPTSGLDSQTSWAISVLIRKLANSGQAVLYLGKNSPNLIEYLERNGAPANPAEWMPEVVKLPKDGSEGIDWHQTWRDSPEYQDVKEELARLRVLASTRTNASLDDKPQHQEFVSSFFTQFWEVTVRTSKHFWRSPMYMWSKTALIALSLQRQQLHPGLQNQLWAIFMFLVLFININEQIMPMFVPQRNLYESRERPSKIYRWTTYIMANILIELFWNLIMAVIRGFLVSLFPSVYLLFTSVLTSLLWMLCTLFYGIGVLRADLPGFWAFMYRTSPPTYLVGGIMSTAVAYTDVTCADYEVLHLVPPSEDSMSCDEFPGPFPEAAGGPVLDPAPLDKCGYCPLGTTNDFLARFELSYDTGWRDFGLVWAYILFNIGAALGLYWAFRVPKGKGTKVKRA